MNNQRGLSALLVVSLMAAVLIPLIVPQMMTMRMMTQKQWMIARNKNLMTIVASQIETLAVNSSAYRNCNSSDTQGAMSCQLNMDPFKKLLKLQLPGAQCSKGVVSCGIEVRELLFNPTTMILSAKVEYTGVEFSYSPIEVSVSVPPDVLQSLRFHCPTIDLTRPIFTGFEPNGHPKCRGVGRCPLGSYIVGVNPQNFNPYCEVLPNPISCPLVSFIGSYKWAGGASVDYQCSPRLDPFLVFPK